ncbi:unnamed protein product [Pieris macdunnoughi]|uniref:Uncharacterized protein n=1 Tax=Pieris macdunnoughi TaxID=345717 RepID=A0A821LPW8_9NEOP|nr:unnamed protein product [Pieris macdunnoughi]
MHIAIAILVFQCTLSRSIKVPVTWDNDSEVKPVNQDKHNEYFHYSGNKPHFAVEVAQFHNVKSPENHYESYPINPHTGLNKPQFGKHQMLNSEHKNYKPYQEYVKQDYGHVKPITNYYEVYHPYEAEVPALQTIYKDPILNKIRNDVVDAKNRLQKYEHDAGESDVHKDEYLERPDSIDKKKVPHKNIPVQYEIHRPVRRPIYYQRVPIHSNREHILNQKLRHPWSQSYAKVTPMHYHPLKHNLHQLRQQHSLTYDDSKNEYPQIMPPEQYAEKPEGYDIYEKGKENYKNIRNGFEESINKAVLKNRPIVMDNLELQKDDHASNTEEDENEEFIPIKNYAQVRKTTTFKHLPKSAAYEDADNLEEIQNAPRLREAIKSSKNQVVYSEEGYEDSAYDHAGEQKHASDHEGHGGFLTENEASKGKYKIPTVDTGFTDEGKTSSIDQILHGEKWNDEHSEDLNENDSEDYSENENDYSERNDAQAPDNDNISERNKRESNNTNSVNENLFDHDLSKREVNLNLSSTKEDGTEKNSNLSRQNIEISMNKYPYYFNSLKALDKNSPLRYSENLNLIPNKTKDNSAFYNSRLNLICPEVEKEVNPVPDKFDNDEVSQDSQGENYNNDEKGEEEFKKFKDKQRLEGLGDKIDCFKKKYFGPEPLDSPFFTESLIKNPQPLELINSSIFSADKLEKHLINQQKNKEKAFSNGLYGSNNTFEDFTKNQSNSFNKKNITIITKLRKKRGVTFMYEPYKVIKDSQAIDSKKFPTSSNISPVIRKLQTRQTVDTSNNQKYYKDIGKNERPLNEQDFIDVSKDQRRGEPRYEIDLKNHRPQYSPVENKTSMSIEDYKEKTANKNDKTKINFVPSSNRPQSITFKYIPRTVTTQNIAASNIISKTIQSTTIKPQNKEEEDLDADYEEYEDESDEITEEKEFRETTSTTTSTTTPNLIKRIHLAPTAKPKEDAKSNSMKLQLTTRFHTSTTDAAPIHLYPPKHSEQLIRTPNYREKKKKTTKSTLVTDTESYGDDTDDMKREEIDAMIGIKQDMDEYTPTYEKENKHSDSTKKHKNSYEKVIDDQLRENDESQEEEDDDDDSSEEDEYDDGEDDEDDEDDLDVIDNNQENKNHKLKETSPLPDKRGKIQVTTSEPTKRTLIKTTEPTSTTEVLYDDIQPTVYRKKVEIHKELPVNKTSPHVTHYKQDLKEVEIIKEVDRPHIPNNNHPGSLNLYKDESLAREINNLGDIDVFHDNIDFENGPKHGGNYRSVEHNENSDSDVETSQSQSKKIIEPETSTVKPRNQNYRNTESKRLEKSDMAKSTSRSRNVDRRRKTNRFNTEKSAKLIELQDDDSNGDNVENYNVYNGNSKADSRNNNEPMHGGNYRSAKITLHKNNQDTTTESSTTKRILKQKLNRKTEAEVLNAYARAATEITTIPAFILDPSKRMYYYLED